MSIVEKYLDFKKLQAEMLRNFKSNFEKDLTSYLEEKYPDLDESPRLINPDIKTKERYDEIAELLEYIAEMLYDVYGTNQQMRKREKGGSIKVEEYDCGH